MAATASPKLLNWPKLDTVSSASCAGCLSLVSLPIGLVSDGTWGLAASGVRAWFARSPRRLELIGGLGGLAIIGVGVTLALTGRRD